jgi:hypothetical protein
LAHPIWLWVWETGNEDGVGVDETWQQPVLDSLDVTEDMVEPLLTFKVKGTDLIGTGSYSSEEDKLFGLAVWSAGRWYPLKTVGVTAPVVLIAIPRIGGRAGAEFICTVLASDEASRAA